MSDKYWTCESCGGMFKRINYDGLPKELNKELNNVKRCSTCCKLGLTEHCLEFERKEYKKQAKRIAELEDFLDEVMPAVRIFAETTDSEVLPKLLAKAKQIKDGE